MPPAYGPPATPTARSCCGASRGCPVSARSRRQIFLALLGKQYGVNVKGWRAAAGQFGKAGTHISVADIVDAQSMGKVRSYKKQLKAAAKAAK